MTKDQRPRRMRMREWRRAAERGLCCSRCGGSQGVWAPKVLCPRCRVEQDIRSGGNS
ncbi:MAG: hypothetical protein QG597_684 [Actinomycetota bacterium]|nr:hypothetical protein [Actinomycetota bacterium]